MNHLACDPRADKSAGLIWDVIQNYVISSIRIPATKIYHLRISLLSGPTKGDIHKYTRCSKENDWLPYEKLDHYNTMLAEICLRLMLTHSTDIETCIAKNEFTGENFFNIKHWNI